MKHSKEISIPSQEIIGGVPAKSKIIKKRNTYQRNRKSNTREINLQGDDEGKPQDGTMLHYREKPFQTGDRTLQKRQL